MFMFIYVCTCVFKKHEKEYFVRFKSHMLLFLSLLLLYEYSLNYRVSNTLFAKVMSKRKKAIN